jgi:hypothetical protein
MAGNMKRAAVFAAALLSVFLVANIVIQRFHENGVLKEIIKRLEADTRVAEVLVTGVNYDAGTEKNMTTIKFLEYGADGKALEPKYFTFSGNSIQFQSLVVRFDDRYVRAGDKLRGKSAHFFWKVFMLDGARTQEFDITKVNEVPEGYRVPDRDDKFQKKIWGKFWKYALDPKEAGRSGIKNAQIEAPGTIFIPGMLYTIRIESDGGLRIEATRLSAILRGERLPE